MQKNRYTLTLSCFILLILFSYIVLSDSYDVSVLDDTNKYNVTCKAYMPNIQTADCNYDGGSINNNLSTDLSVYGYQNGLFVGNMNLTLNRNMTYMNNLAFGSCDLDMIAPLYLNVSVCKGGICEYLGEWNNTETLTADSSSCFSNGHNAVYNVSLIRNTNPFDKIKIHFRPHTGQFSGNNRVDFSEMRVQYFNYTLNYLPDFNVTFEKKCVNSTEGYTSVNYSVSTYDIEDDIIYVNPILKSIATANEQKEIYFSIPGGLFPSPNYLFLDSIVSPPTSCTFDEFTYFDTNFTLRQHPLAEHLIDPYMLKLTSFCIGVPEYFYKLDNTYSNLAYETSFHDFMTIGEQINISVLSTNRSENYRLIFTADNATSLGVHYFNGTDEIYLGQTIYQNPFWLRFVDQGLNNLTLYYETASSTELKTIIKLQNKPNSIIKISIANAEIYQEYFKYAGTYNIYNFTSDMTREFIAYQGYNEINFQVTDDVHLGESYNEKDYTYTLPLCSRFDNSTFKAGIGEQMNENIDPVYFFRSTMGNSAKNYFDVLGYGKLAESGIYIVWFVMLFMMIIGTWMVTGRLTLEMPNLIVSFGAFFISVITSMITPAIVFAVFVCMSLASIVAPMFVKAGDD